MARRTLTLALLALLTVTVHAQRFDWVKSYSGQEPAGREWNRIVSSVTDSRGNLYVAGIFAYGASIDGQELLPPTLYNTGTANSCIMKISPEGEIMWTKILHANNWNPTHIYELQLVGDTALYASVCIPIPYEDREYLYFYDTLITKDNLDYLQLYMDSLTDGGITTAISVFDLDGNLTENYILYTAYKDRNGKLITLDRETNNDFDTVFIALDQFKPGNFCVDNQGNIYFGHITDNLLWLFCDTCDQSQSYNISNGLLSEVVVIVNGRQLFSDVLSERSSLHNYRIWKFAPHFSDLLACRYVFSNTEKSWSNLPEHRKLVADADGNHVYLSFNLYDQPSVMTLPLQGDTSKSVSFTSNMQGVVIEYDTSLVPLDVIQLLPEQDTDQILNTNLVLEDCISSNDSNALFIIGVFVENGSVFTPTYRGQVLDLGNANSNAFAMKIERGSNSLGCYDHILSTQETDFMKIYYESCGLTESNGRIFAQVVYKGNIQCADSIIRIANNKWGTGVIVWDHSLRELEFIDLNIESDKRALCSSLSAHDSSLYIMVSTADGFTLGNTTIPIEGNSVAVIARYVDSIFCCRPYSQPVEEPVPVSIEKADFMHVKCHPNPTNSTVSFELPENEPIIEYCIISSNGIRHHERNSTNALDLSAYPSGIYYIEIITDRNIYKQKIIKL